MQTVTQVKKNSNINEVYRCTFSLMSSSSQ
uniref:Uncharacterized protein n=1 Tax=Arundo donax TaxID=35708 RepID=A0A0A9B7U1_ARUDO